MERQNVAGYVFKVDTAIHPRCFPYSKCALSRFRSWKMRRLFSMHIFATRTNNLFKRFLYTNTLFPINLSLQNKIFCMIWHQAGWTGWWLLLPILSPDADARVTLTLLAAELHWLSLDTRPGWPGNIPTTPRVRPACPSLLLSCTRVFQSYVYWYVYFRRGYRVHGIGMNIAIAITASARDSERINELI